MANRNVSCKIKLYRQKIKCLTEAESAALEKTAEALHSDLQQSQTMPFETGSLQGEKTSVDYSESKRGSVRIVSDTPYARRLYYHPEYHYNKSENPNAGGKWFADYLPGGKKQDLAQRLFNKFYKQETGI